MKPVDIRNESFADLSGRIDADRATVLAALRWHGICTTRQLAEHMGRAPEFVRPRVTELFQIGAVALAGREGHEGLYRARMLGEWMDWYSSEHAAATGGEQLMLL